MAKEFCRNRTYETKIISHLPHEYRFADGSKSLVVDYATTDQLDECRKIIEDAALRGDNVGVDEYEKDSESTKMLFEISEIFQAHDPVTQRIEAFMFIQPCLYQRTYDSCTASNYVFRTKDIDDEVYAELLSLVAEFAKEIDTGYTQCFTQVALCIPSLLLQLRRRGFLTVAVLPDWVNIAGSSLRDNAIMVKDFGLPERPIKLSKDVLRMLESHLTPEKVFEEYTRADLRQIPGLPRSFLLKNGATVVLRNARKDEDHILYEMLVDAVEKGDGYSVYEFPSLNIMRVELLASSYMAVMEEESTRKLIGFLIFHDAAISRSGKGRVCDESAIISAGFRGKGFGRSIFSMSDFVLTNLGYEKMAQDSFLANSPALKLWRNYGSSYICGVLPRSGYQNGVGWVDLAISIRKPEMHVWHLPETKKCRL